MELQLINQITVFITTIATIIIIVVGKHCCGHLFLREHNSSICFDESFEEVFRIHLELNCAKVRSLLVEGASSYNE